MSADRRRQRHPSRTRMTSYSGLRVGARRSTKLASHSSAHTSFIFLERSGFCGSSASAPCRRAGRSESGPRTAPKAPEPARARYLVVLHVLDDERQDVVADVVDADLGGRGVCGARVRKGRQTRTKACKGGRAAATHTPFSSALRTIFEMHALLRSTENTLPSFDLRLIVVDSASRPAILLVLAGLSSLATQDIISPTGT